ncbi:hypothetical protein BABINDRAFT_131229 [Babjeviella inositovora NRRL Y-12698]|uniref:Uncharacterized protein n=1 Tax=Babjeviella inositovora NRRL Y-12698 TaxID=984486 RepID=A0A1E3QTJ9_9ASCO|nr:uncharacterized protein BABINDRAFT_131229 [Babjeviella inositovora NRRL Y-12698]ODQ80257.1 hypothetical protein BABINDRAFT_131229 [Babjeviella inositovora NRRL Y-12698]
MGQTGSRVAETDMPPSSSSLFPPDSPRRRRRSTLSTAGTRNIRRRFSSRSQRLHRLLNRTSSSDAQEIPRVVTADLNTPEVEICPTFLHPALAVASQLLNYNHSGDVSPAIQSRRPSVESIPLASLTPLIDTHSVLSEGLLGDNLPPITRSTSAELFPVREWPRFHRASNPRRTFEPLLRPDADPDFSVSL